MTAAASAWDLTVAVVAALEGDATLAALIGADGVYADQPPAGRALPYLTIGATGELEDDRFANLGRQTTVQLHVWATTNEAALKVYAACLAALDRRQLAVTGHTFDAGRLTLLTTMRDPTGVAHAVLLYVARTREALT